MAKILIHTKGNKQVYRSGELVSGEVVVNLTEAVTAKAVRINLQGQAEVKWTDVEMELAHHGHYFIPKPKTIDRQSRQHYFSYVMTLWGTKLNESGPPTKLLPGNHRWTFSLRLPKRQLPSSFEGQYGAVQYWLKVEIHKPFPWPNIKRYAGITVLDDLNMNAPYYNKPVKGSNEKIISKVLGLGNAGKIQLSATTDKRGYCSGEAIGICATMANGSSKDMKGSKAKLIQRVRYFAEGQEKTDENVISVIQGAKIPKGVTMQWEWERMPLDYLLPSSRSGSCQIMTVSYYIKIYIEVPMGFDLHVHLPIVIGTVPRGHRVGSTAASALPLTSYAKCNRGCYEFSGFSSSFPNTGYIPMTAVVPNFRFVAPVPGGDPPPYSSVVKAAPTPAKKTSSLPAISTCCVAIRFAADQLPVFQSTLRANKSTLEDHSATVICLAEKIDLAAGVSWSEGKAMSLIVFPTKEKAKDWVQTTPEVSESGWLGGADITLFTMREPNNPDITRGFFSIEMVRLTRSLTREELLQMGKIYTPQMRAARKLHGGSLVISAASKNYENVRGGVVALPYILMCLQFPNAASYEKYLYLLQTDEYKVAMDFWSPRYRTESRVTMETVDMRWWTEESLDVPSNAQVQRVQTEAEEEVEKGVYFITRFPFVKFIELQTSIKAKKSLLSALNGRLVAMAPQIMTIDGTNWPVGMAIAILRFRSSEDAKKWFVEISQGESVWLSECDAIITSMAGRSHDDKGTFMMSQYQVKCSQNDARWIKNDFAPAAKSLRLRHGGTILFNTAQSLPSFETVNGDWITGKWRLTCSQWPGAKAYFNYKSDVTGVEGLDRFLRLVDQHHVLLFETADLAWLEEEDDRDKTKDSKDEESDEDGLEEYKEEEDGGEKTEDGDGKRMDNNNKDEKRSEHEQGTV